MKYFSGFGLRGDYAIFKSLLCDFGYVPNHYDIIGFSSGALSALQCAMQMIIHKQRVGRVILLSPLFYTYHFTKDFKPDTVSLDSNPIEMDIDILMQNLKNLDSKKDVKNATQVITHLDFEAFARELSHLHINTSWNLFKKACIHSYKKDKLQYYTTLYKKLGFHIAHDNMYSNLFDSKECRVFTHFEKLTTLRNLWNFCAINLEVIREKSQKFAIFIAEHDKITNSKLISDNLSGFGICYILKGRSHILQKIAMKRA